MERSGIKEKEGVRCMHASWMSEEQKSLRSWRPTRSSIRAPPLFLSLARLRTYRLQMGGPSLPTAPPQTMGRGHRRECGRPGGAEGKRGGRRADGERGGGSKGRHGSIPARMTAGATCLGEDVVVEDVVEGGDQDDARGQGRVRFVEPLQEERDAHLEEGLEVHTLFLLPCPRDLGLTRRHLGGKKGRKGKRKTSTNNMKKIGRAHV